MSRKFTLIAILSRSFALLLSTAAGRSDCHGQPLQLEWATPNPSGCEEATLPGKTDCYYKGDGRFDLDLYYVADAGESRPGYVDCRVKCTRPGELNGYGTLVDRNAAVRNMTPFPSCLAQIPAPPPLNLGPIPPPPPGFPAPPPPTLPPPLSLVGVAVDQRCPAKGSENVVSKYFVGINTFGSDPAKMRALCTIPINLGYDVCSGPELGGEIQFTTPDWPSEYGNLDLTFAFSSRNIFFENLDLPQPWHTTEQCCVTKKAIQDAVDGYYNESGIPRVPVPPAPKPQDSETDFERGHLRNIPRRSPNPFDD